MKIESIYVENLRRLQKLRVMFPNPTCNYFDHLKISVMVGENGTGKTSVLEFLSNVFFYPKWGKEALSRGFEVNYVVDGEERRYTSTDWGVDKAPSKVIVSTFSSIEPFRTQSFSDRTNVEYVYTGIMGERGRTSLQKVSLSILEAFYGGDQDTADAMHDLLEFLGYPEPPVVEVTISPNAYQQKSRSKQSIPLKEEVANRLREYHVQGRNPSDLSPEANNASSKIIMPDKLTPEWLQHIHHTAEAGLSIVKALWLKKGQTWIRLSQLSSGELTMFHRFFPLIKAMSHDALVLIDEPETHLHPRWIQQYVTLLAKVFGRYRSHIILATHSPMIASDVPKECIVGLVHTDDGRIEQYTVDDTTLGGDPEDILRDVFQLDDYHGQFTTSTIQSIKNCLHKGDIERALAMFRDLGTSNEKYSLFHEMKPYLPKR